MKIQLEQLGNRDYESTVKCVELSNWSIRSACSISLLLFKCQQNKSKQLASEKDKNLVLEKKINQAY
jgi:hypothetical protein